MDKERILRKVIVPRELSIIKVFNLLNRELINKNYELSDTELESVLDYLKTGSDKSLDEIWTKNSLQRNLFLKAIEICEFYGGSREVRIEERKLYFLQHFEDILNLEDKIYKAYRLSTKKEKDWLYDDDDFTIYYIGSREEEKDIEWGAGEGFFHIILDGVISLEREKKMLFSEEIYFSRDLPDYENFNPINNRYKKLVLLVKKHFFDSTQIKINKIENGKLNFIGNRNLVLSLLKKDRSNLNKAYIFQMTIYMIELFNRGQVEYFEIPFVALKKSIVRILNENICMDKKNIISILLKELNISSSKLYKVFYSLFESSASKYIDRLKIDKACYYLHCSEHSVEEISYKIGMTEQTFSKKFYGQIGVTPSNFRRGVDGNEHLFRKSSC